jgi:hypothetical protein
MFISKKHLSRRTFLRGAGAAMALPFLESMVPAQTPLRQTAASPKSRFGRSTFRKLGYRQVSRGGGSALK